MSTKSGAIQCVIVGIARKGTRSDKVIYEDAFSRNVSNINAYLISGSDILVESHPTPLSPLLSAMQTGSVPNDGGNLILGLDELSELKSTSPGAMSFVHRFYGSEDYLQGDTRYCLVIPDPDLERAKTIPSIAERLKRVAALRAASKKKETREQLAKVPHRFQHRGAIPRRHALIVPSVSSERREWFPTGILPSGTVVSNLAFMIIDAPLWNMALIASRLHLSWIGTVCGKLKTDYRYSNTLGWNTFPVPTLTDKNEADLTRCAEDILLAREHHFPATIAELYDPDAMPADLRAAHDRNDEVVERIYIGRRFRNDTERLEKLFDLHTRMTAAAVPTKGKARKAEASA